jgi:hypothetical protein
MTDPTPIVDVPISGGVQYGANPGDFQGISPDPGGGTQWGSYVWFDPMSMFCNAGGVPPSDCAKWCRACSSSLQPQLVNTNTLPGTAVVYPAFTPLNIANYGLCQIFWMWMWSLFVSQHTGNAERPVPPAADAGGDGPGTGGGGHG